MRRGYVKLYRRAKESGVFTDKLWRVFCYCLLSANHKPYTSKAPHCMKLPAGSFTVGRYQLARELKLRPSTAVYRLEALKAVGVIDTKTDTRFTVVTVKNWAAYQGDSGDELTPLPDTKADTLVDTLPDTLVDTLQECKNGRMEEGEAVLRLSLEGGGQFAITREMIDKYREAFPRIAVEEQLRRACLWCDDNPGRRKTRRGAPKFLSGWLGRAKPEEDGGIPAETPQAVWDAYAEHLRTRKGKT